MICAYKSMHVKFPRPMASSEATYITFQMRGREGSWARIFQQTINLILIGNLKYLKQEQSDRKSSKTNMIKLTSTLVTSEDTAFSKEMLLDRVSWKPDGKWD